MPLSVQRCLFSQHSPCSLELCLRGVGAESEEGSKVKPVGNTGRSAGRERRHLCLVFREEAVFDWKQAGGIVCNLGDGSLWNLPKQTWSVLSKQGQTLDCTTHCGWKWTGKMKCVRRDGPAGLRGRLLSAALSLEGAHAHTWVTRIHLQTQRFYQFSDRVGSHSSCSLCSYRICVKKASTHTHFHAAFNEGQTVSLQFVLKQPASPPFAHLSSFGRNTL